MKKYLMLALAGLLFGMQGAKAECNDECVKACRSGTHEKICKEQRNLYYLYSLSKLCPSLAETLGKWLIEHNIEICKTRVEQLSSLFLKLTTKDKEFVKAYILKVNPQISPEEAEKIAAKLVG